MVFWRCDAPIIEKILSHDIVLHEMSLSGGPVHCFSKSCRMPSRYIHIIMRCLPGVWGVGKNRCVFENSGQG